MRQTFESLLFGVERTFGVFLSGLLINSLELVVADRCDQVFVLPPFKLVTDLLPAFGS